MIHPIPRAMMLTEILIPTGAKKGEVHSNNQLLQGTRKINQKLKRKSFRSLLLSRSHKLDWCLKNLPAEAFQGGGQSKLELKQANRLKHPFKSKHSSSKNKKKKLKLRKSSLKRLTLSLKRLFLKLSLSKQSRQKLKNWRFKLLKK